MFSRRTLLRGVGASVALPWLEIMTPSTALSASEGPPVRMAYFCVPNGVHMPAWRPADDQRLVELPPTLAALEPIRDSVTVISNLAADYCDGNDIFDLIGLDLRLAQNFPPDSIGFGFDSIGESLTLTPTQTEIYHDAAKKIKDSR